MGASTLSPTFTCIKIDLISHIVRRIKHSTIYFDNMHFALVPLSSLLALSDLLLIILCAPDPRTFQHIATDREPHHPLPHRHVNAYFGKILTSKTNKNTVFFQSKTNIGLVQNLKDLSFPSPYCTQTLLLSSHKVWPQLLCILAFLIVTSNQSQILSSRFRKLSSSVTSTAEECQSKDCCS